MFPAVGASAAAHDGRLMHQATSVPCRNVEAFEAESLDLLLRSLREALDANPFRNVVVGLSGGSTPGPLYAALRQVAREQLKTTDPDHAPESELNRLDPSFGSASLDFSRVIFFLVDERYVPATDPKSNVRLVMEHLFGYKVGTNGFEPTDAAWPHKNFHFCYPDTSLHLDECVQEYRKALSNMLSQNGGVDLAVLGMGDDGHCASLFPPLTPAQYAELTCSRTLVVNTTTDRFDVRDRISVTLHFLAGVGRKIFLIKGESKLKVWLQMEASDDQSPLAYPVLDIIRSGGTYVVSYPSLDDYARRERRQQCQQQLQSIVSSLSLDTRPLSIIIFGASGDLAKKKTYPALFSLFCEGLLPMNVHVVGFARSKLTFEQFWKGISEHLAELSTYFCRQVAPLSSKCEDLVQRFRSICSYVSGAYDTVEGMQILSSHLKTLEGASEGNRLAYFALPPDMFAPCARVLKQACWSHGGWNRVVVEKPFGRDSASSEALSEELMASLDESEIYRIDHYLGKEMALTIIALRFANVAFKPLFQRNNVRCVRITCKEDFGTQGRGGYFDSYGIIRDVMQNHMLQLLTLVAMEPPASLRDEDVRDEKVKVLKQMPPIKLSETILGQYTASADGKHPGYLDDPTVPRGSRTPTFCTCALWIENERWKGVPFIFKAGKALEKRCTEIRIQLQPISQNFYPDEDLAENELVIIVQPREAIYLKFYMKKPGLGGGLQQTELDLSVMDRLQVERLPDAYERLLLDVIRGDKQNFVRTDELREAWRIFTPLLHEIEALRVEPEPYPYGSHGPPSAYSFIQRFYSYHKEARYHWQAKH